jgi:hypothetical protein
MVTSWIVGPNCTIVYDVNHVRQVVILTKDNLVNGMGIRSGVFAIRMKQLSIAFLNASWLPNR